MFRDCRTSWWLPISINSSVKVSVNWISWIYLTSWSSWASLWRDFTFRSIAFIRIFDDVARIKPQRHFKVIPATYTASSDEKGWITETVFILKLISTCACLVFHIRELNFQQTNSIELKKQLSLWKHKNIIIFKKCFNNARTTIASHKKKFPLNQNKHQPSSGKGDRQTLQRSETPVNVYEL